MNAKIKVGLTQTSAAENTEENIARQVELIRRAAAQGARIICTQELFRSLYFCRREDHENFGLAETIPGPSTEALCPLAKELNVVIVASLFEKRAPGLYHNTAVVIDADGSLLGLYRKMHIPDDPSFYEKFYFTPGDLGFKAFDTAYGRIGVLICWDQWYPEAARLAALQGAEILFYPTAIGWGDQEPPDVRVHQREAWQTMHRAHAIANGIFVAAPNRIGREGEITFWGSSLVYDPHGAPLAAGSESNEEILIAECDLSKIESMRQGWPFLRDRRIDAYGGLLHRFLDEKESKSK